MESMTMWLQLVGKDLHITAVLGQRQLEEQADDTL